MRRELAIHHFSHRRRRQHTAPPSFSRDTELQDHATLSVPCPMTVSLTLPFDHPGKAEPTMNGLGHRPPLNIVLRHDLGEGRNRISQSLATRGCRRDTVRGGAVATGVATPIDGQRICSPHGRVASRDTTVPDPSTASPDAVPQSPDWQSSSPRGIPGNSYSLMLKNAEQNSLLDIRNSKRKGVARDYPWAHETTRQVKEQPRRERRTEHICRR